MRLSRLASRAALLGFVGVAACDVYAIATDPFPGLVQTWSFSAPAAQISVADLLPAGVSIYSTPASNPPDSIAFSVSMPGINYDRPLAPNCPACASISGTTAPKPAFSIGPGNGSAAQLPDGVDSATVLGATISYTITNGFSFDPIRVNPSDPTGLPQGRIDIMIRSGSVVLARDSLKGDTDVLPPGDTFTNTIELLSGKVGDSITVELLVDSPSGEPVFMDVNRNISAVATITDLLVADVKIQVQTATLDSETPEELDLGELDSSFTGRAIGGGVELTVTSPFAVTGDLNVVFTTNPGPNVTQQMTLAAVTTPQTLAVTLDSTQMSRILNSNPPATMTMTGSVSAPAPITVTPKQFIAMTNRVIMKIRAFGGTQ